MTEKEKQEKIEEIYGVKKHRTPSGKEDSLAIEVMQIKQRQEPTLDVCSNRDVVVKGLKDGTIKAKKDNEEKEIETGRN